MTIELWIGYVGVVLLLMSTPGPSHLLMLSVSMSNGFPRSLATAGGDLTANALQIMLAGLGLASILTASTHGFAVVKWAGVAYLVWIGIRQIISSFELPTSTEKSPRITLKALWTRGFVTSAANPKAVFFFAALFPQFINPNVNAVLQVTILGVTYLVIDGIFLTAYGKSASWIARKINGRYRRWIGRAAGSGLVATAVLLGFKTTER